MRSKLKERKGFLTVYAVISMLMIIIILGVISFNVHNKYMTILKLQTTKKEKKVDKNIEEPKKVYISDINEFDRMFNTNQGIANSASVARYNELKQGQNNIFYSARMGGNIKLMVDEEANAFGRVYVLEFATEGKLNEIRSMYAQFIQNDYPFMMFSKE
ncbi:MAG: hypothetical protein HG454_003390 [Clostridiales bacterium]|nr:hypothetical protein [Clostridiales bacterium]